MAQAKHQSTTQPLSTLIADPYVRAAFDAAERDGLAPVLVEIDRSPVLEGGAAVRPALEFA